MTERYKEIRCAKCGRKLGEYAITDGTVRILCTISPGRGKGACRTMNVVTVCSKKNVKFSSDAI